jgi:hypothetical protein
MSTLIFAILSKRALIVQNTINGILTSAHPDVNFNNQIPSQYSGSRKYFSFRGGVDEFSAKMPFYELTCK